MTEITRSPLCWPSWIARTRAVDRDNGRFGKRNERGWGIQDLTITQARNRLLKEIESFNRRGHVDRIPPDEVIISTNLDVRNDGLPRSGQKRPNDPGVAVYFILDGESRCIPCDSYKTVEDNIAAIAATLDCLRTIERHGSQMFKAAFSGFDALPSPDHVIGRSWRDVLDYYGDDIHVAEGAYKIARKSAHPDHGGSSEKFNEVQLAWEQAREELK